MKMISTVIGAIGALAFVSCASAADVGGHYTVEGTNFDGSKYSGEADITVSSNTTCHIEWKTGETASKGICMRVNDVLVAGYSLNGEVGLVAYQIKSDGVLDGIWTMADKDGAGTDVLTPAK
ncbi:MAG TPA: hypothetical protein VGG12_04340 [Methylovirgula sp.]|jgi:hypothetical protein